MRKFTLNTRYSHYDDCFFRVSSYASGGPSIEIWSASKGQICHVTCDLEGIPEGCIAVKDYSENTGLLDEMKRLGLVERVITYRGSGFVMIPICKYNKGVLREYNEHIKSCLSCEELVPIGEGDHICLCREEPALVLENYEPTENFFFCNGEDYIENK